MPLRFAQNHSVSKKLRSHASADRPLGSVESCTKVICLDADAFAILRRDVFFIDKGITIAYMISISNVARKTKVW
jgi:hypothetical protein